MIFYKLYLLVGLLEVTLEFLGISPGVTLTKPLLMPLLAVALWREHTANKVTLNVLLAALFFSWLGDVALLFQSEHATYFVLGLCAFLLAHVLYISAMRLGFESSGANLRRRIVTLIAVASLIVLVVIYFEREGNALYTGVLRFAVPLYALVLGMMVVVAACQGRGNERHAVLIFSGALLFMFSDLTIALGAFSGALDFFSESTRSGVIMATYILAQFLIIRGMVAQYNGTS